MGVKKMEELKEKMRSEIMFSLQEMNVESLFIYFMNSNPQLRKEIKKKVLKEMFEKEYYKILINMIKVSV